ncbi:hypothetical protein [Streptomyces exfoliatus]|uniref:hypothetical protein n=1 Tax=Streptomyces exfoliatus TaxID=1905 RepID=UPI0012FF1C23|nr:hypothetical protein [Streptomyces exfoliatus]
MSDTASDGKSNKLEEDDQAMVRSVMNNSYNGTDLNTVYDPTPTFSGEGETDVYFEEYGGVGPGLIGITWCNDAMGEPPYACDQQHIRILPGYYSYAYGYGLVCHETGHAVGLLHGGNAYPTVNNEDLDTLHCMVKSSDTTRGLGPTNVANINSVY